MISKKINVGVVSAIAFSTLLAFLNNEYLVYIYFAFLFVAELVYLYKRRYEKIVCQIVLLIPLMGVTVVNGVSLTNIYSAIFALYVLLFDNRYAHSRKTLLLYSAFVLVDIVKVFIFSDNLDSVNGIINIFTFYLSIYTAVISYEVIAEEKVKLMFANSFILGTFSSILYGFITRFLSGGLTFALVNSGVLTRNSGASGDPNYFGLYIGISIAFMLIQIATKKAKMSKYFTILLFGFLGMSSSSRMYYIILVFLAIIILVQLLKQAFSRSFIKTALVVIAILLVGFTLRGSIGSNIEYLTYRLTNESDITNGRLDLVEQYNSYMSENDLRMVIGIGVPDYNIRSGIMAYAHNFYVELYVTQGFFGVAVLLFVAIFIFIKKLKNFDLFGSIPLLLFAICGLGINFIEVDSFYVLFALIICFAYKSDLSEKKAFNQRLVTLIEEKA